MQPSGTQTDFEDVAARVSAVIAENSHLEGPLLPILHGVQGEFGCVPREALPIVADALNLSRAEVHGVMSFYHDFREAPAGRHVVKVCRAEACQSMGGARIAELAKALFNVDFGETSADGGVTLEAVYCLGLCACAPAVMVDGRVIGRVDAARMEDIAGEVQA